LRPESTFALTAANFDFVLERLLDGDMENVVEEEEEDLLELLLLPPELLLLVLFPTLLPIPEPAKPNPFIPIPIPIPRPIPRLMPMPIPPVPPWLAMKVVAYGLECVVKDDTPPPPGLDHG